MADLFNRTAKSTRGGFKIDSAKLTFSGLATSGTVGMLIQNVQIQYQQQVTFVYDLADPEGVYYVAGKAQGTLAMSKIVGSAQGAAAFYKQYGDACKIGNSINIEGVGGSCEAEAAANFVGPIEFPVSGNNKYEIVAPLIVSYGMTMSVNEGTVGENIQMQFAQLNIT